MSIFKLTRKTDSVQVGETIITLTEPSALERMAYGEHFASIGAEEKVSSAELLRMDVNARIGLVTDCMAYALPDVDKCQIRAELMQLPPENLNALSASALKLAGLWVEPGQDESEKKPATPDQSEQ